MGGSSSKPLLKGDSYSQRAQLAKGLADTILTLLFQEADFKDLLTLSSISQCPRYVFTTATALQQLFQSIQVYPQLGKSGEYLFSPIDRLSPGLLTRDKKEETQETRLQKAQRDRICMDIAYIYVRIFQIYGALALTVLDADPIRPRGTSFPFQAQQRRAAPGAAVFYGGAIDPKTTKLGRSIEQTPFSALLPYFSAKAPTGMVSSSKSYLKLDDKTTRKVDGEFYLEWDPNATEDSTIIRGVYYYTKYRKFSTPIQVEMKWIDNSKESTALFFDGTEIIQFTKEWPGRWVFVYPSNSADGTDSKEFVLKVHKWFADSFDPTRLGAAPRKTGVTGVGSSGIGVSVAPGKSSFESFDQLKKLYDDRLKGLGFPKAYCIARAMTLLKPIFDSELPDPKKPYVVSQVCKKDLDFESAGDQMPRAGKQPKANIYLRSLVSLYYDNYEIQANGNVIFSQSPEGRENLRKASTEFAQLFNVAQKPEEFLESGTAFTDSRSLCAGANVDLWIKDPALRQKMLNECVLPMIKFQEQHTAKVNELLKKMFIVTKDKLGRSSIAFSKELKGGRAAVNQFGVMARDLLKNYYIFSEAYYTKGIRILEQTPQGIQKVL